MIPLIKALGLPHPIEFCPFLSLVSRLLLVHRACLCKIEKPPSGETQPNYKVHGLKRGAQLTITSPLMSWVGTVQSAQLHVTALGNRGVQDQV